MTECSPSGYSLDEQPKAGHAFSTVLKLVEAKKLTTPVTSKLYQTLYEKPSSTTQHTHTPQPEQSNYVAFQPSSGSLPSPLHIQMNTSHSVTSNNNNDTAPSHYVAFNPGTAGSLPNINPLLSPTSVSSAVTSPPSAPSHYVAFNPGASLPINPLTQPSNSSNAASNKGPSAYVSFDPTALAASANHGNAGPKPLSSMGNTTAAPSNYEAFSATAKPSSITANAHQQPNHYVNRHSSTSIITMRVVIA